MVRGVGDGTLLGVPSQTHIWQRQHLAPSGLGPGSLALDSAGWLSITCAPEARPRVPAGRTGAGRGKQRCRGGGHRVLRACVSEPEMTSVRVPQGSVP